MPTATHLTSGSSTTNATTYTTASISPTAGRLILVAVETGVSSGTLPGVTVSGCGLTWDLVDASVSGGTPLRQVSVFRAMGTPTAGTLTFTSTTSTVFGVGLWSVVEFDGIDTSGTNGSGAIAQSFNSGPTTTNNLSVAYPTAPSGSNGGFAGVGVTVQQSPVGVTGWTTQGTNQATPATGFAGLYADTCPASVTATWTTSTTALVVGVEVKAASLGGPSQGTAAGTWTFTGTATGTRAPKASGSGTWAYTGTATGTEAPKGAASGSWAFAGAASGKRTPKATGAGSWSFTGAASGTRTPKGTATGTWTFAGTAAGTRQPKATGVGTWSFTGAASGVAPTAGGANGTGSGTWNFTGAAVGKRTPKATATGTWASAGAASGKRTPKATAAGTWAWTGAAAGAMPRRGAGTGAWAWVGTAAGHAAPLVAARAGPGRILVVAAEDRRLIVPPGR